MITVLPAEIAEKMDDATPACDAASDAEVNAFLAAHTAATRPEVLDGLTKALANKFAAKLSRHGSTVPVLAGAMKEARAGYYPAMVAYDTIRPMFLAEVARPPASNHQNPARTGRVAESEFYGILAWAIGQALAADLNEVRARVDAQMPDNTSWMFSVNGQAAGSQQRQTAAPLPPHDAFWTATPELALIREWARARRVGPWGLLGVIMARVVATIPPTAQIPPYTGYRASLNLFINLVARSGYFKGATIGAARDAVQIGYVYATGPGSGEGINHLFAYYDKASKATVFKRRNVYFSVPEVDTLGGLDKRSGSTLLSQLCKAWSGESLTFAYVDQTKALEIPDHSYRLCMVVGVQPGRAGTQLDATDSGVPQRFLWLPTDDPNILDVKTPDPLPLDCREAAKYWPDIGKPIREIILPANAIAEIDADIVAKHRGKGDPALDGHLGLCRIKTAIALALLHGKPWDQVTDQIWDLSKVVMEVSQHTRDRVEAHLAAKTTQEDKHRGTREGIRGVAADDVKTDAAIKRVASGILRYLGNHGQTARSVVRKGAASRDRDYFEDALERLIASGQVQLVSGANGDDLKPVNP